jgi:Zn finger protein HypA/HybF involved in hydrogenase expression
MKTQRKTKFVCNECGRHFTKTLGIRTVEVSCPKCHGVDVEVDEP